MKIAEDIPVATTSRYALDVDGGPGSPAWVTVAEAAFLAGVTSSIIEGWAESGAVRVSRLTIGRGSAMMLIRTQDVLPAPTPVKPATSWILEPAPTDRPLGRRSSRSILVAAAGLAAILLILFVQRFLASPEGGHPNAAPSTQPGVQPSGTSSSSGNVSDVHIGHVRHIRQGRLLSASVVITNPNPGWWLPPSDLTFRALDRRGKVIATYQTTVTLGHGGSKIVVAPLLYLGPNAHALRSMVVLDRARWQPVATFVPNHVRVSDAHVGMSDGTTVVRGHIANGGNRHVAVQISCVLWAGKRLAGVGIASVPNLSSGTVSRFVVAAQFLGRKPDATDCTADPIV